MQVHPWKNRGPNKQRGDNPNDDDNGLWVVEPWPDASRAGNLGIQVTHPKSQGRVVSDTLRRIGERLAVLGKHDAVTEKPAHEVAKGSWGKVKDFAHKAYNIARLSSYNW